MAVKVTSPQSFSTKTGGAQEADTLKVASALSQAKTFSGPIRSQQRQATTEDIARKSIPQNDNPIAGFVNWGGKVASQIGNLALEGAQVLGSYVATTAQKTYNFAAKSAQAINGITSFQSAEIESRSAGLRKAQDQIVASYRSGRITKSQYDAGIKEISEQFKVVNGQNKKLIEHTDPMTYLKEAADTALLIASYGKYQGLKAPTTAFGKSLARVEELATKVPAVKALFTRNAEAALLAASKQSPNLASTMIRRSASALLFKMPFVYNATIDGIGDTIDEWKSGQYGAALRDTALTLSMALDGGVFAPVKWVKNATKGAWETKLLEGTDYISTKAAQTADEEIATIAKNFTPDGATREYIEYVGRMSADGDSSAVIRKLGELQENDPERYKLAVAALTSRQHRELLATAGNAANAAARTADHWRADYVRDFSQVSVDDWLDLEIKHARAQAIAQAAVQDAKIGALLGVAPENVSVSPWNQDIKDDLYKTLKGIGDKDKRLAYLQGISTGEAGPINWAQHQALFPKVYAAVQNSDDIPSLKKAIMGIKAGSAVQGLPKKVQKLMDELGYVPIVVKRVGSPFVADVGTLNSLLPKSMQGSKLAAVGLRQGEELMPILSSNLVAPVEGIAVSVGNSSLVDMVSGTMQRLGVGLQNTDTLMYNAYNKNFADNLEKLGFGDVFGDPKGSRASGILGTLQRYADTKRSVTDLRQLRVGEVASALGVANSDAKLVMRAMLDSWVQIPTSLRSLGDKAMDLNYRYNPLARGYSRVQSALRYTYNPFFRLQEITETEIIAQGISGGKMPQYLGLNRLNEWFLPGKGREINKAVKLLDDSRIFSTGFGGAGAQDAVLGRITANITTTQKKSIAGFALRLAEKQGKSLSEFISENPDEMADAIRVLVQYPRKGVLSSSLARTMNLVAFPVRYNAKVTALAAKALMQQPPVVQVAFLHGMMDFTDWLKSDEGIQWQSKHAEAIKLFSWITPINSLTYAYNLFNGKPDAVGEFGLLGGLPFGIFSQIMNNQGVINLNTPYVDIATGDTIPKYIPTTLKARANVAMQDMLGSLFTFPGRTLGLPGKGSTVRDVVGAIPGMKTNRGEFRIRDETDRLTDLQKRQIKAIQDMNQEETMEDTTTTLNYTPALPFTQLTTDRVKSLPLYAPTPKAIELKSKRKVKRPSSFPL